MAWVGLVPSAVRMARFSASSAVGRNVIGSAIQSVYSPSSRWRNLLTATSKLVCEVKARYLQLGSTLDVVPSADGRRIPTAIKGVLDYGADDTGSGVRDVRGIPPTAGPHRQKR